MQIIRCAFACCVVIYNAFAETWRLTKLYISLNDRIKNHIGKMLLYFFYDLV